MRRPAFREFQHPRGPNGRFTESRTTRLDAKGRRRAAGFVAKFRPRSVRSADDATTYLSGLSGTKQPTGPAVGTYLSNPAAVNNALRAGKADSPGIAGLDAEMKPLPDDLQAFRRVPSAAFGDVDPASLVGTKVRDAGFFPTTLAPAKGNPTDVLLHLSIPAGTKGAPVPDLSAVLLDRALDMAVTDTTTRPDGGVNLHLVVMPDGVEPAGDDAAPDPAPPDEPANEPVDNPESAGPPTEPGPLLEPSRLDTVPDDARPYHLNLDGLNGLADAVTNQTVTDRQELSGGGTGQVERVTLDDGTEVFGKTNTQWQGRSVREQTDAEQLASRVGQVLEAPVTRVYRTGEATIVTDWAQGRVAEELYDDPDSAGDGPPDTEFLRGVVDSPAGRLLGLLDVLAQNQDRHVGNWMVTDDGGLTGIDHGLTWMDTDLNGRDGTPLPDDVVVQVARSGMQGPFLGAFFDEPHFEATGETRFRDLDFMTAGDVAEIRGRLEALRPEFEHLGRGAWLDYSLRVLSVLEPHATGSRSIFGG